jgi:hypothetical protein
MSAIEAALAAIESLKPGDTFTYSQVAREFGVDRTTLSRRHRGRTSSKRVSAEMHQHLHPQQEKQLVRYIERLTEQGLPPSRSMIRNFGSQIAKKELGYHWVDRFLQRFPDKLISRWTVGMDNNRHKADSALKYRLYFSLLRDKIEKYQVEARYIYNMDEKGFMLGVVSRSKRIFSKASYEAGRRRGLIQDGSRQWITLLACICADGSSIEPSIIYQSDASTIQDSWLQAFDTESHDARFCSSPSGWTNNEIGLAWLKQVFDRNTKSKARSSYRLLIVDGHGSHLTMDFIEYCDRNKILLAIYPPHATHTLQPLDVSLFKPLSTAYSAEISSFMEKSQGLVSMSKRDFWPMFWRAWKASFTAETIIKAFEATGLSPLNPEVILQRFNTSTAILSDSESSELSASNWKETQRLFYEVVKDRRDPRARKLCKSFHSISVQKTLLQHEAKGLKEALIDERSRRKLSKVLPLEADEEYHGGAVFWSPRKVREARERQHQKQLEEEQQQHQKRERQQLREAQKQQKAQEKERRRIARAAAAMMRATERAEKAAEKAARIAARRTAQRLQKALKTSQNGNKMRSKASITRKPKKSVYSTSGGGGEASGATPRQLPLQSRRGRAINTPARFL